MDSKQGDDTTVEAPSGSEFRFLWWSFGRRAWLIFMPVALSAAIIFAVVTGWKAWLSYRVHGYTQAALESEVIPQAAVLPPGVVQAALLLKEDQKLRSQSVVLSNQSYDFTQTLPPDLAQATQNYLQMNAEALSALKESLSAEGNDPDVSFDDKPYSDDLRERMRWLGKLQHAEVVVLGSEAESAAMVDALIRGVDLGVALRGVADLQGQYDAQLIEWQTINPYMQRAVYVADLSASQLAELRSRLLEDDVWPVSAAALARGERLRILDVVSRKGNAGVVEMYGSAKHNDWQHSNNWHYASWVFGTDMADRYETLALLQSVIDADEKGTALERLRIAQEELVDVGPMTAAVVDRLHDVLWGRYVLEADRRVMACSFAVLQYRKEKGRLPEALADLVPEYFAKLPDDPFRRLRPLNYKLTDDGFVLYSVGLDGDDDHAVEAPSPVAFDGDVVFRWSAEGPPRNLQLSSAHGETSSSVQPTASAESDETDVQAAN